MFNSETLEVAIGMAFLFLFVSIICTAVKEWLEGLFKWRAMDLERALRTLLADADGSITSQLLRHPLLDSLFAGHYDPTQLRSSWLTPGKRSLHMRLSQRRHLPSYIPAAQFATALIDSVLRGPMPEADQSPDSPPVALSADALRQRALALASPHLQRVVLTALDHSAGDLAAVRVNIEQWFNGSMDRASGWYKRRTQAILFMLGLGTAVVMNIDALYVMQRLILDKTFREVVVKQAATVSAPADAASSPPPQRLSDAKRALRDVGMPMGWRDWSVPPTLPAAAGITVSLPLPRQLCAPVEGAACQRGQWLGADWWLVLAGWVVTAYAVMLGAPFWFDLLNKFMVIRSTVKPHEKSPEESSEDRQSGAKPAAG